MKQRDKLLVIAFSVMFAIWAFIAYQAPEQRTAFYGFVATTVAALAGILSHRLNPSPDPQPPAVPAPTPKEPSP